ARATGTHQENVLPASDIVASDQVQDQWLVDAWTGGEVELVQQLGGGEASGLEPSLGWLLLALDPLQLPQLPQARQVIDVLGRTACRHLVALAQDGRQLQCLEVMLQKHRALAGGGHGLTPPSSKTW